MCHQFHATERHSSPASPVEGKGHHAYKVYQRPRRCVAGPGRGAHPEWHGERGTGTCRDVVDSTEGRPQSLAPSCVTFSQYKHGNFVTGYYTNVYIDNGCPTARRVKVIMDNGFDSSCLQLPQGQIDYFVRSDSDTGLQPSVARLDNC
jgi:hypothetical protein